MNCFKMIGVSLMLLVNLLLAQPVWADPVNLTSTPDYTEVMQAIDTLLKAKESPEQSDLSPEAIAQQLGELNLQKYILETAKDYAQCRNETGKTLAVYAHKGKKVTDPSTLYYLANGQTTDDDWNCDGVYLPTGTNVAGLIDAPELTEPLVAKVVGGTQLVAKTNATGGVEFNLNPAKVLKAGEGTLAVPNLTQATIDATAANAPIED